MIRATFSVCIVFVSFCSVAQTTADSVKRDPIQYFNQFASGILFGEKNVTNSATFSMVHGVRTKPVSAGIGIGYDTYERWNVFPLTVAVSPTIGESDRGQMFMQFQGGYAWLRRVAAENEGMNYEPEGGITVQGMLGYRIYAERFSLYMMFGYKHQQMRYSESPKWWTWGPTAVDIDRSSQRVLLQIGFGFH